MPTKTQAAREFLRTALSSGPRSYVDIKDQATAAGITRDVLGDAARALRVERERDKSGRVTMWGLPGSLTPKADTIIENPADRNGRPVTTRPSGLNYGAGRVNPIQETAKRIASLRATTRSVEVWRYEDGKLSYLVTVPAAEFSMAWLQQTCGGGRYAVEGIDEDVLVSGPPLWPHRPQGQPAAAAPTPAERESSTDRLLTFLLEERRATATRASTDPMAMALEIVKVIQAAQPAAPPPAARTPVGEIAAFMREMKELGIEVGAVGDDDGDDGPSFPAVLQQYAPGFNAIAQAITKHHVPPGPPPVAVVPAPVHVPSVLNQPEYPDTPAGRIVRALAPHVSLITAQARMRVNAKAVADYLFEQMDDDVVDDVDVAVDGGQFVDDVLRIGAPLIPAETAGWYRELLTHVQQLAIDTREGGPHPNGAHPGPPPAGG